MKLLQCINAKHCLIQLHCYGAIFKSQYTPNSKFSGARWGAYSAPWTPSWWGGGRAVPSLRTPPTLSVGPSAYPYFIP